MKATSSTTSSIDNYIGNFPPATQQLLKQVRTVIKKEAPDAAEKMGYGIPTFTLYGNLVHFAGYKNHIGFYPGASGISQFRKELAPYATSKGAVQFPLDKLVPTGLIARIVKFRVKENLEIAKAKSSRTCSKGHRYYKTTDCPTCPVCERARKPSEGFLASLAAPARRAMENQGIKTVKQLSRYTEAQLLVLHGMGPASLPLLRSALKAAGLSFKK
jgi:uncharacterized protein YdhG (YjbR/CyaY superfamily)